MKPAIIKRLELIDKLIMNRECHCTSCNMYMSEEKGILFFAEELDKMMEQSHNEGFDVDVRLEQLLRQIKEIR